MTPLTLSLRPICRMLLVFWLVLLVGMSALVAGTTRTPVSGNQRLCRCRNGAPCPAAKNRETAR